MVVLGSEVSGFVRRVRMVFGLEMRGLFRWASISDEDDFVRRMERIWRLGAAGFGTPGNEGPCRGLNVGCWGLSRRAGDVAGESVVSHKRSFRRS